MTSPLSLHPIAHAHQDDAAGALVSIKPQPLAVHIKPAEPNLMRSAVVLSFAFDVVTRSLNVVMTDKISGEVVRKIAFTHFQTDAHQTDKLHGVLLDQFA
jgi:hypothetical protein